MFLKLFYTCSGSSGQISWYKIQKVCQPKLLLEKIGVKTFWIFDTWLTGERFQLSNWFWYVCSSPKWRLSNQRLPKSSFIRNSDVYMDDLYFDDIHFCDLSFRWWALHFSDNVSNIVCNIWLSWFFKHFYG
jgi:hypothetical protein